VRYQVKRSAPATVEVPAGRFQGVAIRLEARGRVSTYEFEAEAPHRLLRFRAHDGTEYRLAKAERLVYWSMHEPGDEAWWPTPPPSP
jgi:hypothetical protein